MLSAIGMEKLIDRDDKKVKEHPACYYNQPDMLIPAIQEAPWLLRLPIVRNGNRMTVGYKPEIWETYREIGKKYEKDGLRETAVQKTEFYPRGAKCYACIATGETALYANIILKKGVVI